MRIEDDNYHRPVLERGGLSWTALVLVLELAKVGLNSLERAGAESAQRSKEQYEHVQEFAEAYKRWKDQDIARLYQEAMTEVGRMIANKTLPKEGEPGCREAERLLYDFFGQNMDGNLERMFEIRDRLYVLIDERDNWKEEEREAANRRRMEARA